MDGHGQRLVDIAAITRIKGLYGDTIDRIVRGPEPGDREILASLFTQDAVIEFPMLGRHAGLDAILQLFCVTLPGAVSWMWHSFHSPVVSVDGDVAEGRWTLHALAVAKEDPQAEPAVTIGRYIDRFVRHDDGWRLLHLRFLDESVRPPRFYE